MRALILVFCAGLLTAAPQQDDRAALRAEIESLKRKLAEIEQRVAALPEAAPTPTHVAATPPAVVQAAVPTAPVAAPAPKVPFGFGDFTWMNGQSRQKSQP